MATHQTRLTPPELAVLVSAALRARGIHHAVGGALALAFYAEPRGTLDVDLNVFVDCAHPDSVLTVLRDIGIDLAADANARVSQRGDLFLDHRGCRLDVFFSSISLHESAAQRSRVVGLLGSEVPILSPEDLIVLKLLFNRGKDIVDIEAMVTALGDELDGDYVHRWLVECVGDDDPRLQTWARLAPGTKHR